MVSRWMGRVVAGVLAGLALVPVVRGQALPSATRAVAISAFAAGGERSLRVGGASNTEFTAGVDAGFLPIGGLRPMLELRGTYPVLKGDVAGEHEFLGGLRLGRRSETGATTVYGNLLFGRGQLDYYGKGLQVPGSVWYYRESHSTIVSPGGGIELESGGGLALKLDLQYERYGTPVSASGSAWAAVATVGVVWRLDFERRPKGWY
jgi:hypothetical protein